MTKERKERLDETALQYRKTGNKLEKINIDGKPFLVMREISPNSGLTLITITAEKEFYQYGNSFVSWYIVLLVILFVGGIILSVVLSKSNYEPIGKLVKRMTGDGEDSKAPLAIVNEFDLIATQWTDILNKNAELNAMINRQRPMVVSSCLRNILKGTYKTIESMDAMLKSANINLGYEHNFVILLPVPLEDSVDDDKSIRIMTALSNFMLPHIHVYGLDMLKDDGIAVIVNCQEKEAGPEPKDIRLFISEHLKTELKEGYELEMPFYIGRIYENPLDISRSFIEASAIASDYKMLGNRKVILFEEIGHEEQNLQYPILEQALYIQCLKQANEDAALKALENMIQEIEPLKSFVITQCLCFDIINMTIKTLDQLKGFELKDVDLKKMITFSSLTEFHDKAARLTSAICRQFAEFKDSRNNEMKAGILDYVNGHFGDSGMGLESVADEFRVSSNYLSRFFKQETGCSFIQYVTMIRMDRAKELLINSDMQVKEIVAGIGYIDVANFVRKFKGYEGVTPGQYRERMRNSV